MRCQACATSGGEFHFNQKFLQFAPYYGFVPRACRPYRPETKGTIESTVSFVKQNFWPGISCLSLADLNHRARAWMEKVNRQAHSTTREVPYQRLPQAWEQRGKSKVQRLLKGSVLPLEK